MNRIKLLSPALLSSLLVIGAAQGAATLTPIYLDDPGEGFNDPGAPHTLSSDDGNPGGTLGEQRKWAFEKALEFWEQRLESNVTIQVEAEMSNLSCSAGSAILGSAGFNSSIRDWPADGGSEPAFSMTWYGQPLANSIANRDLCDSGCIATDEDIGSEFNKDIDNNDDCLAETNWYYALGDASTGTISFYKTVLHEIGHGINVATLVDLATGEKALCGDPGMSECDDIYMKFLEDHSLGENWPTMSSAERAASAEDTDDLHWTGAEVLASTGSLGSGVSGGHVEIYAPGTLEPGSSVSHWDTDVDDLDGNSELMEPIATGTEKLAVTDEMLHDMGWNDVLANNCAFAVDRRTISGSWGGTNAHTACVSVTFDGAVINSGSTSGEAGQQIIMKNGFNLKTGATFSAKTDPSIGL